MLLLLPFLAGLLLLLGASYAWWQLMESRFTVVSPDRVYTSAAMKPERLRKVTRCQGIRTVVDLRGPEERCGREGLKAEAEVLAEEGVTHLNLASPQVPTEELRDRFLEWTSDPEHLPALIHCNHGEGRAVLYGALWRIELEGVDPETARKGCRRFTTKGSSFDPAKGKGSYLRSYVPTGKVAGRHSGGKVPA